MNDNIPPLIQDYVDKLNDKNSSQTHQLNAWKTLKDIRDFIDKAMQKYDRKVIR